LDWTLHFQLYTTGYCGVLSTFLFYNLNKHFPYFLPISEVGNAVHFSLVKTSIICNSEWKRVYRLLSQNICVLCYIIVEPNSSLEIFTQSFHMSFGESRKCNKSSCTNNSLLKTNFYVKYEYMCILLSCRFFNVLSKSDSLIVVHCCHSTHLLIIIYCPLVVLHTFLQQSYSMMFVR
jgi:hypothetical protein